MIPYRVRRTAKRLSIAVMAVLLIVALVLLCWLLWLNRYVVYTRDGVRLDFSLSLKFPEGQLAQPPEPGETVDIYYNEGENEVEPESTELTQLAGVYITGEMLASDFSAVESQLRKLPAGTPVMVDVKNIRGDFYYSSTLGKNSQSIDPASMDALIATARQKDLYLIARAASLRDYWFGLENVNCGIFNPNRMSLWMDADRCYWLNPNTEGTLTYLVQIITELRSLGFDEVVLSDFRFPDTDAIYFEGDRDEAINATAKSLVNICSTDTFAVSFANNSETFALPEGRSRLFLENISAADAALLAQQSGLADPNIRLVFLTDLMDTRFEEYGVLRPIKTDPPAEE